MSKVLAVYGSLRYGGRANGLLKQCKYLGQDKIKGRLYNLGSYPGVRLCEEDKASVVVDLYEIPEDDALTLPTVDRYEGYYADDETQSLYIRKEVLTEEGAMPVDVYEYNAQPPALSEIKSGDYFDE